MHSGSSTGVKKRSRAKRRTEACTIVPVRKLELLAPPPAHVAVAARAGAFVPDTFELRLGAIAEALFADDRGPPDPKRVAWVCADFRDFASRASGRGRLVLLVSVWVLTWIAPLLVWRLGPLAALDVELRATALERVERNGLLGFAALAPKAMLCLMWFEHPDTQRETQTEPSCLK